MKTLVYIDPQSYGNLSLYDYSLLQGIKGYRIIYCCNKRYDAPKFENVEMLPIFTYTPDMNPLAKIISYLISLLKIITLLKRVKPDTLHIQWWRQWNVDYAFLSLYKKYARQVVFTAHNLVPHDSGDSMKEKCIKYYNQVDKIIVHDHNSKNDLITDFGIPAEKIGVIAHGILDFKVNDKEVGCVQKRIQEKYNLKDKLVFSSMGRQSPYKGTDLIKEAFLSSDFLKNNPNVFLIIAGKGKITTPVEFENQCNNAWIVDYMLSDVEFQAVIRLTDVMLLPYRKISQSGVLLSTIQNQTPFAVTPIGGLTEPFNTASVGWVIPAATVESVRGMMESLAKNIQATKAVKRDQSAWDKVKAKYDWTNISKETEFFYKS